MAKNEFEKKWVIFLDAVTIGRVAIQVRLRRPPSLAYLVPLVPVPSDNFYYINKLPERQVIKTKKVVVENPILRTGGEFRNEILHFIFFRNGER